MARGHKSTKVPNVKLRPAPAKPSEPSIQAESSSAATSRNNNKRSSKSDKRTAASRDAADAEEQLLALQNAEDDAAADEFNLRTEVQGEKKPLDGKTVTLTGIRDGRVCAVLRTYRIATHVHALQTELQNKARALGANIELALTEDVTHLIAEATTSEKYKVSHASDTSNQYKNAKAAC